MWLCRTVTYRYFCLNHPTTEIHCLLWTTHTCNTLLLVNKRYKKSTLRDRSESVFSLTSIGITVDVFERTKWKGIARKRTGKRIGTIYLVYRARHHERCINRLDDRLRDAILFHSIDRKAPLMTTGYLPLARTTLDVVFNRTTRSACTYATNHFMRSPCVSCCISVIFLRTQ